MSLTIASITLCVLLVAVAIRLVPDRLSAIAHGRKSLCETLTVSCALAVQRGDRLAIESMLQSVTDRNQDVLSAAVRRSNGELYTTSGDHEGNWPSHVSRSTLTHMYVPIQVNDNSWGRLELSFISPAEHNWTLVSTSALRLIAFIVGVSLLGHWVYLSRVLRHLDPSRVIPVRVRQTLDALAEGVLVLDNDERIVLANEAFAEKLGRPADELQGHRASDLPWMGCDDRELFQSPWERSIREGVVNTGQVVKLGDQDVQRVLQVNSAPIPGENGENRGALATFSDVTALEIRNSQLGETLTRLKQSRDRISEQNDRLRTLAMIDPLTQCLNRRAFFEDLENQIASAERRGNAVSYVIMDIDHFKLVNDNHGHKVGDEVLRQTGEILRAIVENQGSVCRYGGEEFSLLLPHAEVARAAELAEEIRDRIESTPIADLSVTASFGVVQVNVESEERLEALDQADKALYYSKRSGRNRVTRWDQIPREAEFRNTARGRVAFEASTKTHIPFTAVSVLLSALQSRSPETAEHSRQVANLCVELASGQMSQEQRYVLEVAALLHDVGKLSVPDNILLKPSPLTEEEWKVMDTHLRLGEKTVKNAFASQELIEILRTYRASFNGQNSQQGMPEGQEILLSARILQVADAFDSMISPRPYRTEMSKDEAFAELRRCAGTQFDPEVVEQCIQIALSRSEQRLPPLEHISADAALQIGAQLERLVFAIDGEDVVSLKEMVDRLATIAERSGGDAIADLSDVVHQRIEDDAPWSEILELCSNLLDLCRQSQYAYTSPHADTEVTRSSGSIER